MEGENRYARGEEVSGMPETAGTKLEFEAMQPTRKLDMRGQTCPVPTTETLRVLEEIAAGEVLEVESDYYPAKSTIPYLCDERGYTYALSEDPEAGSAQRLWRIRIQKT